MKKENIIFKKIFIPNVIIFAYKEVLFILKLIKYSKFVICLSK